MQRIYLSPAVLACILLVLTALAAGAENDDMAEQRQAMLEAVRESVRQSEDYTGYSELSDNVMLAMGTVPRHEFVAPVHRDLAYRNTPLPIESGQTISQPLIVALMTELLQQS